jgi:predicted permease
VDVDEDVQRELQTHLDMRVEELVAQGWGRAEAEAEAGRLFGDRESVARECRAITQAQVRAERRSGMMEALWQDVRYGLRTLWKAPEFAVVAVLTLGLGIGANTAIFSVVDGVLLEPLPYDDPGSIVWLREQNTRGGAMRVAFANFRDWHRKNTGFQALAAYNSLSTTILGGPEPVTRTVSFMTEDFWRVFRLAPSQGRLTLESDHGEDRPPVAVVSERFWRNELGGAPLEGLVLEVLGDRHPVVGVVGADFDFPTGAQVWIPVSEEDPSTSRSSHNWDVVGRLGAGVTLAQATSQMESLTLRLVADSPEDPDYLATGVVTATLRERMVGGSRRALLLLLGAAGLVLVVACTNLASTLLARGTVRNRELAIRASLGAHRRRIIRQLLTENVLVAGGGALVGVGMAALVVQGLKALGPASIPRLDQVSVDGSVLVFAAVVAILTVLTFGLLPARRLARSDVGDALREGDRGNAVGQRAHVWRILVGGEVALALLLLTGSGLLLRSFHELLNQDAGFHPGDVTTISMALSQLRYETPEDHAEWYRRFIEETEAGPGVARAGFISAIPAQGALPSGRLELDGDPEKFGDGGYVLASGGAFEALDIPLIRGRVFDDRDGPGTMHVAVVSQSFADTYWPGEDPIGKSVSGGGMDGYWDQGIFSQVVGVVGDVRFRTLDQAPVPTVYFSYRQRPFRLRWSGRVVVEAEGDPAALTPFLRSTLRRLDSDVPPRIATMDSRLGEAVAPQRFTLLLLGGFALLALLLAAAGIYGVVSYQVAQRTREMGIRLALGGRPTAVRALVMKDSLGIVVLGLAAGLVAVFAAGSAIRALLYGVEPGDPVSLGVSVLLLFVAALTASWIPARRSTRVDPAITMRGD